MRNLPPGHSLGPRSGLRDQGRDVQSDCSRQWRRELNRAAAIRWRDRRKVERGLAYPVREIAKQYKRAESTSATWCIAGPTYECSPEKWHTCRGRRNASIKSYASGLASSSSKVGSENRRFQWIDRGRVLHGPIPPTCLYRMPEIVIVQDC